MESTQEDSLLKGQKDGVVFGETHVYGASSDWAAPIFTDDNKKKPAINPVNIGERNHLVILTQMYGSVWPRVFPYCIFNVVLTLAIFFARNAGLDLTIATTGHSFMGTIVSFLLVQLTTIVYGRFMEARGYLTTCFRSSQDLVQHMAVLTFQDTSVGARRWRLNVSIPLRTQR